jgi:hypothetical protein
VTQRRTKDEEFLWKWERKAEEAGQGAWFRNDDEMMVVVDVAFYPKLQRWITEGGERRKISAEELARDYHRLRL